MKSHAKPIVGQLVIAALILTFVTVLAFGIRQVRFSLHRIYSIENPVVAVTEPDSNPADPHTADTKSETENDEISDENVEDEPEPQPSTEPVLVKQTPSMPKSSKKNAAKSKSKGLEQLSLGDNENLYRTKKGELWYVRKQPDGKTVKMQVHIDDTTGEITIVDAKPGGSKNLQKISLGKHDSLYITEDGEQWYVSKQPDGSSSKSRVHIDDATGKVTVIEDYSTFGNGQKVAAKN